MESTRRRTLGAGVIVCCLFSSSCFIPRVDAVVRGGGGLRGGWSSSRMMMMVMQGKDKEGDQAQADYRLITRRGGRRDENEMLLQSWIKVRGGASRRSDEEDDEEEEEEEKEEEETMQERIERKVREASSSSTSLDSTDEAIRRAKVEIAVEDHNGLLKLEGGAVFGGKPGHFIVMPMTDLFDPPLGSVLHDKLQYSDKVMLPKSFIYEVLQRKLEPPWQFEIEPLDHYTGAADPEQNAELAAWRRKRKVPRLHCSNFDFKAPENYIFLPDWMMKTLRLRPRDVVSMKFLRLADGGLVAFQPHSASFSKMANPHAVLESELKYYSCVTKGTMIQFKHNGKEYKLDVVETLGPKDVPVEAIRVQDTDIRTDIRPSIEEVKKEAALKKKREEEAKRQAEEASSSTASSEL